MRLWDMINYKDNTNGLMLMPNGHFSTDFGNERYSLIVDYVFERATWEERQAMYGYKKETLGDQVEATLGLLYWLDDDKLSFPFGTSVWKEPLSLFVRIGRPCSTLWTLCITSFSQTSLRT